MMNGQAVKERAEQDPVAQQRAVDARKWRREVADELSRYRGEQAINVVDDWIRFAQQDIEHKRRELWGDVVELNRLRAYRRKLANMPEPQL